MQIIRLMQGPRAPSRIRHYRLMSSLGSTRNSVVYLTNKPGTSERLAIKLIHCKNIPPERIENECSIQKLMNHKYVMPVIEAFDYAGFRAILMPRSGGSVLNYIEEQKQRNSLITGKLIYRIFKSVHYIHSLAILHGDIKPSNILLDEIETDEPIPRLIDFGHSCDLSTVGSCSCKLMTCSYSSPELLRLEKHGLPSDIWSLAATVYFMITGREILCIRSLHEMANNARNLNISFDESIWCLYPNSLRSLLTAMLKPEPADRIPIEECLSHRFFKDLLGQEWLDQENEKVPIIYDKKKDDLKVSFYNKSERCVHH